MFVEPLADGAVRRRVHVSRDDVRVIGLQQPVQGILHLFLAVAAPEGDAVAFDLISCKDDKIWLFPVKRSVHELERIRRNGGNLLQIGNLHHLEASIRPDA